MIWMKWNQDKMNKITELKNWVLTKVKADTRKLLWTARKTEENSKSANGLHVSGFDDKVA